MAPKDDIDELLDLMESRARHLGPTRDDSASIDQPLKFGDSVAHNYYFVRVLYESDGHTVLLVRHHNVDRQFAMKVLPPGPRTDAAAARRFQEEARATSMLGHENIVFVTDFGRSPHLGHFYVMEYLNGQTLASRLVGGAAESLDVVLNIAAAAGAALASVHELGLVHRDVRPANLMSHRHGDREIWKLLDFGRSSKVVAADEALPLFDELLYLAPEVALAGEIGPKADQFSLAATLFHSVFGIPPWPERTGTAWSQDEWKPPSTPPANSALGPVERPLWQVMAKAMSQSPTDRFDNIDEFVATFQSASGQTRIPSLSPVDISEAQRVAAGDFHATGLSVDLSFDSPKTVGSQKPVDLTGSVEICVADLPGMQLVLTMAFKTARRLRREWRRNIIGGSVFVPTNRHIEVGKPVLVVIEYVPTGAAASFPGEVVGLESAAALGLAVAIEPSARDALHKFVGDLQLSTFDPRAIVQAVEERPVGGDLTTDEKFVLSKVEEQQTIGALRRTFSNLPVPVDDVVARLEEKGWIQILGAADRSVLTGEIEAPPAMEEIDSVIGRADYLREQGNYLAEIETLRIAVERYHSADLLHRLAFARLQFQFDLETAISDMERAVTLAPDDPKIKAALESLQRFEAYDPE